MNFTFWMIMLALVSAPPGDLCEGLASRKAVAEVYPIGPAWSGHPVGFCLYTSPPYQYVGYYDAERRLVIAQRELASAQWNVQRLPTAVGWDSHNSIEIAVDQQGYVHVTGNMHVTPLIYFRTTKPHDISTFERVSEMVGRNEDRVTYPRFLRLPDGTLVFMYRDGASGRGRQFINRYDVLAKRWDRLLDQPLLDGGEEMSAYPVGPLLGPDGLWHLCWMWRDTPDCATNHDVSYARSRNLVHWETIDGVGLELPLTPRSKGVVVDPVPVGGGLINTTHRVGFDTQSRVVISYHKYDGQGRSQIYNARWENGQWLIRQVSQWDYRWAFSGRGSIGGEISAEAVQARPDGRLVQGFRHARFGSGLWVLDEDTLVPLATCPSPRTVPPELHRLEVTFSGLGVRFAGDKGVPAPGEEFILRWETLPPNRDRPREGPLPPPSTLRLYRLTSG